MQKKLVKWNIDYTLSNIDIKLLSLYYNILNKLT